MPVKTINDVFAPSTQLKEGIGVLAREEWMKRDISAPFSPAITIRDLSNRQFSFKEWITEENEVIQKIVLISKISSARELAELFFLGKSRFFGITLRHISCY